MSSIATTIACLAGTGISATTIALAEATEASPWGTTAIALLVSGLMIPVVRWMMSSIDARQKSADALAAQAQKSADALAERRELREEKRDAVAAEQVLALKQIATDLRVISDQNIEAVKQRSDMDDLLQDRMDRLPNEVARQLLEQGVVRIPK